MKEKTIREVACFGAGRYWVSSDGDVFMRLKTAKHPQGYDRIGLRTTAPHSAQRTKFVHRLVAEAFLPPPPPERIQVNHIDGNKDHNAAENLEWVTPSGNVQHAVDSGLRPALQGADHPAAKFTDAEVRAIRARLKNGETAVAIAAEFGVGDDTIARMNNTRKDRSWRHVW